MLPLFILACVQAVSSHSTCSAPPCKRAVADRALASGAKRSYHASVYQQKKPPAWLSKIHPQTVKNWLLKSGPQSVNADQETELVLRPHKEENATHKTKYYDPTSAARVKHPQFSLGQRLIHNAKVLLRNTTDSEEGVGDLDSFIIADHEANLIVKGHSDYLRRMYRHAGPDICLAKARALVNMQLDVSKICQSLSCTAARTAAYLGGLRRDLPIKGCQMIEISKGHGSAGWVESATTPRKAEKFDAKYGNFLKSAKAKTSDKSDFLFFCNAKNYPRLLPSVLLLSGFAPVEDEPGFWRYNSTTESFPPRLHHHHWHVE